MARALFALVTSSAVVYVLQPVVGSVFMFLLFVGSAASTSHHRPPGARFVTPASCSRTAGCGSVRQRGAHVGRFRLLDAP